MTFYLCDKQSKGLGSITDHPIVIRTCVRVLFSKHIENNNW
jgi:hypothetical protein